MSENFRGGGFFSTHTVDELNIYDMVQTVQATGVSLSQDNRLNRMSHE